MSDRVLLLGGSGFIGSAIARHLGPDVVTPTHAEADLASAERLAAVIQPGDVIVNAAGYANATDRSPAGVARFGAANVDGVRTLATVAADRGAGQLIHLSSVAAMGRWKGSGIDEEMSRPTASPYADSKRAAEQALQPFGERLPITILRPTSIFGEGRGLAAALCRLASLPIVPLPGGGRALIPFCYVGNLAHAVGLAIGNPACHGRTFIVGDDRSYMLREIVGELSRALGRHSRLVSVPTAAFQLAAGTSGLIGRVRRRPPLFDRSRLTTLTTSVEYSTAAFQAATGYRPPYSLRDATERIAAWYLAERGRDARR